MEHEGISTDNIPATSRHTLRGTRAMLAAAGNIQDNNGTVYALKFLKQ
ncbi:MAG: hypothetical protein ABI378_05945 [Chitinophagaceae bacterium]